MAGRALVLVALPWPLKFIVDNVIFGHALAPAMAALLPDPAAHRLLLLNLLGLAAILLGLADAALAYSGNRLFLDIGQRVVFTLRCTVFGHLERLTPAFHRARQRGEVQSRLAEDVGQMQDFIAALGTGLLPHFLTILGMIVVMLLLDWRYALVAVAITPLLIGISQHWTGRLRDLMRTKRNGEGALWGMAQESLAAVQLVQTLGRENFEAGRFRLLAAASRDAGMAANRVQAQFPPLINLVIALGSAVITWYGALRVIRGELTAGELLVFLAYLRGLVTPARQLAKAAPVFGRTAVAIERIDEILAERPAVSDRPGAGTPQHCEGRLAFRGVRFAYREDAPVLHDISFTLAPGRTVALVGPTGSGKSTLAMLAMRFADPHDGSIHLDGCDLRDLRLDFVRRHVALMEQEPTLLAATVWENIAFGRVGADRAAAIRAARQAGLEPLIARLPDGFDHRLVERGATLSGGQRQAIALARTLLSRAPVLLLDEPSSSLDAETEALLTAALRRVSVARATLVIAHRLSTVERADEILVLDKGRIVQRGSHAALLAEPGLYARLWRAQSPAPGPGRLMIGRGKEMAPEIGLAAGG
ncbi:MAG: ABC transporter ATP-binding protein [Rhodospirillales bacterium]|nr:ABC transporter ATP-binding protein [Rhodospirillales bacterium]MDE2573915.1 ABC transporter ATP-binding protein [Rhodospirillales bacterium]